MVKYVKTEALLSAFVEAGQASKRYKLGDFWELNGAEIRKVMDSIPAADVEEVQHGHWINGKCSVCGADAPYTYDGFWEETSYCPNCGAKMDDNWEEPAINPCRGCEDYDGKGGCISKGGCGAKMEDDEE